MSAQDRADRRPPPGTTTYTPTASWHTWFPGIMAMADHSQLPRVRVDETERYGNRRGMLKRLGKGDPQIPPSTRYTRLLQRGILLLLCLQMVDDPVLD